MNHSSGRVKISFWERLPWRYSLERGGREERGEAKVAGNSDGAVHFIGTYGGWILSPINAKFGAEIPDWLSTKQVKRYNGGGRLPPRFYPGQGCEQSAKAAMMRRGVCICM